MLVLASAAFSEVAAQRLNAIRRRLDHPQQSRPAKSLLNFHQFGLNRFSERNKGNEDDKVAQPPDPFSAEGNVINGQTHCLTRRSSRIFHGLAD